MWMSGNEIFQVCISQALRQETQGSSGNGSEKLRVEGGKGEETGNRKKLEPIKRDFLYHAETGFYFEWKGL